MDGSIQFDSINNIIVTTINILWKNGIYQKALSICAQTIRLNWFRYKKTGDRLQLNKISNTAIKTQYYRLKTWIIFQWTSIWR